LIKIKKKQKKKTKNKNKNKIFSVFRMLNNDNYDLSVSGNI